MKNIILFTKYNTVVIKDITETLREFSSVNISSALLASQLMIIKPRKYSIASAPNTRTTTGEGNVSLVVGVLQYTTDTGRMKRGLATGMLQSMDLNTRVLGSIRQDYLLL